MATVQWRPEKNLLTTPTTWRPRFIARDVVSKAEMAARMARALPNYTAEEFRTFIDLHNQLISESLINGEQVTEDHLHALLQRQIRQPGRSAAAAGGMPACARSCLADSARQGAQDGQD